MLVAGVDDAGRGCVIGPLVIAGVLMKEEDLPKLVYLGAKDSKLLSPNKRQVLDVEIKRIVERFHVEKLSPKEIDKGISGRRKLRRLNWMEARTMARVIEALDPDVAYVDASDVLEERFKRDILSFLPKRVRIISEHKADRNYPIVSAASIIAKVERDREIAELAKIHGDFGSGYPHDPRTMRFLRQCMEDSCEYPDFIRRSWRPAKRTKSDRESKQTTFS
jgi:ribonuclease HII